MGSIALISSGAREASYLPVFGGAFKPPPNACGIGDVFGPLLGCHDGKEQATGTIGQVGRQALIDAGSLRVRAVHVRFRIYPSHALGLSCLRILTSSLGERILVC
jgi:hypothetical protein